MPRSPSLSSPTARARRALARASRPRCSRRSTRTWPPSRRASGCASTRSSTASSAEVWADRRRARAASRRATRRRRGPASPRSGRLSRAGLYHPRMDTASARRLAQWLERADVTAFDPERVAALRAALDRADPPSTAGRGGAGVGYDPAAPRRRMVEFDRRGALVAAYRWALDGGLLRAKCLSADGAWIGIEPGAASHPAWGVSDRLWRLRAGEAWAPEQPVTLFQALDYQRLD